MIKPSEIICRSDSILFCWLQRPQLVKGNMQLFSVDQQRSQALEAHAAAFATFRVILSSLWSINMYFRRVACRLNTVWYFYFVTRRLLAMIRIQLLFVLHPRASMLDRLYQRCMSLNLAPSQVYACLDFSFISQ